MSDKDFSDIERELEEKLKKFVNSQEMKDLQENIRLSVDNTMKEVRRSVKDAAEYINKNVNAGWESSQKENASVKQNRPENSQSGRSAISWNKRKLPVIKKPPGRVLGVLLSLMGTCGAIITWFIIVAGLAITYLGNGIIVNLLQMALGPAFIEKISFATTTFGLITFGILAVFAAACILAANAGGVMRRRAKRFKLYMKKIGNREYCPLEELAQSIERNEKYVSKDLKKMMRRRWFKEGHFDEQKTCFILTDEAYRLYLDTQAELKQQKEDEERQRKEQEILEQDPVRKQLKATIEEGKEYIRRIRATNDNIPGVDISGKLYRLERICTRIFEYIKEKPEHLADIRKFMNYYLPTTLKLVETYYEFSIQPIRGENITTAQKEIEDMLDSINQAFEKMFDKLFEDSAMDISTDISVLSTLLAQEGLLDDKFK